MEIRTSTAKPINFHEKYSDQGAAKWQEASANSPKPKLKKLPEQHQAKEEPNRAGNTMTQGGISARAAASVTEARQRRQPTPTQENPT